ncbi:MAG TPA: enoyl-CoA hydratase-related protein [Candidatus Binataceae bacterium]|nr:enoyl-CoA hydratase-related protein [Candidatus Binataceae bacterium]
MSVDYSGYEFLKIEVAQRVATVTINRPELRNAVNSALHHEFEQIWVDLAEDRDVNAILLTGAGEAFSIGGDVTGRGRGAAGKVKGRGGRRIFMSDGRRVVENLLDVEQPIVAAINGDALGFAANVALLCDITVVSETAKLADTHVSVGAVAGDGGAVIWPLLIGPNRAKEFLMLGDSMTGADAARIGLVNYALPAAQVLPKARELAQRLADGPTWAIRWSKLAVNKWLKQQANLIMDAGLAYEAVTLMSKDHKEAVQALMEKRKPDFVKAK